MTADKNNNQKEGRREDGRVRVRSPESPVIEEMKSTPLMFTYVIPGLSCPIWKMKIVPTYLNEGGVLSQILNKHPVGLRIVQWHLLAGDSCNSFQEA